MLFGYACYDLLAYFLIYACLGWCTEVIYCALKTGQVVNRGFLNGPVCPIYGFGMVAIIVLLTPIRDNLILLYVLGTILPSAIELFGGWVLYKLYHTRWWDYSMQPFNIGGFICLQFCLVWGLGATVMMRLIHPLIASLVAILPVQLGWLLMLILYAVFAADFIITAISVSGLTHELEALDQVAESLHIVSDAMTEVIGSTTLSTDQRLDEQRLQLKLAAAELRTAARELTPGEAAAKAKNLAKDAIQTARSAAELTRLNAAEARTAVKLAAVGTLEVTKERLEQLLALEKLHSELSIRSEAMQEQLSNAVTRRLLSAFPDMRSEKHNDQLQSLRSRLFKRDSRLR